MGGRLTGTTYQPLSPLHPVLPSAAFVGIGIWVCQRVWHSLSSLSLLASPSYGIRARSACGVWYPYSTRNVNTPMSGAKHSNHPHTHAHTVNSSVNPSVNPPRCRTPAVQMGRLPLCPEHL